MSLPRRLEVSIDDQTLDVIEGDQSIRRFRISTARKGMGFTANTHRTPTGRFRISEKIGHGQPSGTIFKSRKPAGKWHPGMAGDADLILSRILRLDGLDPENVNSRDRFIYIHGTNDDGNLGQPASHGCIRLGSEDVIELFEMVDAGTSLIIHRATKPRGKLWFFDCDSTLSSIEGIDELARAKGPEVFAQVVELTNQAMDGEVPINEVFPRRMQMIRPDRETCEAVAALYVNTIVPGIAGLIAELKQCGWLPVILSGGFAPLIEPLAKHLGIDHIEAVPLYLNGDGSYKGYGEDYPTTRNLGKNRVIREWRDAMLPERVVMMGDGISDMETQPDVDWFVGFGGVVARPKVMAGCDQWLSDLHDRSALRKLISGNEIGRARIS